MKIALLSCTSKKETKRCTAKCMYWPSLRFRLSYEYSKKVLKADKIYILSAEYGVLSENCIIDPYNKTLNKMNKEYRKEWAEDVISSLSGKCNLDSDEFVILAGKNYYEFVIDKISLYEIPLQHKTIGEGNKYLKKRIENV